MKTTLNLLLGIVLMTAFIACGNKLTSENFTKVKNGMTEEEVRSLLGKPKEVKTGEMLGLSSTTFTYEDGETQAVVGFINGKVTHKNGAFSK
ncbi:MAG: outer membrane protein assembly factor BamE [Candidatus Methylacidiphilales bacterium]